MPGHAVHPLHLLCASQKLLVEYRKDVQGEGNKEQNMPASYQTCYICIYVQYVCILYHRREHRSLSSSSFSRSPFPCCGPSTLLLGGGIGVGWMARIALLRVWVVASVIGWLRFSVHLGKQSRQNCPSRCIYFLSSSRLPQV